MYLIMADLAADMAAILLTWGLLGALFVGIGTHSRGWFKGKDTGASAIFAPFWIGWAATLIYLQLWQLWLPINGWVYIIPSIVGLWGYVRHGSYVFDAVRQLKQRPVVLICICIGLLWAANHAMSPTLPYDAGLYHLSTIRWENSYHIIPGLGNLHGRLAFNSAVFLYQAMVNVGPWAGKEYYVSSGLLVVIVLLQVASYLTKDKDIVRRDDCGRVVRIFAALLLVPILVLVMQFGISTTSNDLPASMLQVVIFLYLLELLASVTDPRQDARRVVLIALLGATGIVVKASFGVVGVIIVIVALSVYVVRWRQALSWRPERVAIWTVAAFLGVLIPWVVRGFVLSGYAAYPSTVVSLPVSWRVPYTSAMSDADAIIGWARLPDRGYLNTLGNWDWLPAWFARTNHAYALPLGIALIVGVLVVAIRAMDKSPTYDRLSLVLLPAIGGVVAWCVTAPDPRFAGILFWVVAAVTTSLCLARTSRFTTITVVIMLGITTACYDVTSIYGALLPVLPGPTIGFSVLPVPAMKVVRTHSGLSLYVPIRGDQVWNTTLPSTPYPQFGLRLRCSNDIQCGFMVEDERRVLSVSTSAPVVVKVLVVHQPVFGRGERRRIN